MTYNDLVAILGYYDKCSSFGEELLVGVGFLNWDFCIDVPAFATPSRFSHLISIAIWQMSLVIGHIHT